MALEGGSQVSRVVNHLPPIGQLAQPAEVTVGPSAATTSNHR
jgi:hypothetical protein